MDRSPTDGNAGGTPRRPLDGGAVDDLLALAAVLGTSFDVEDLSVLAGRSMADILPVVLDGVERGVLDASGSQLAFRSEDLRRGLLAGLSSWTFRRLTAVSGGVRPRPPARPVAEGALADGNRGLRWLRWTAERVGVSAPEVAVELLQSAVPLADGAERQSVLGELAMSLLRTSRLDEGEAVCREALRVPPEGQEMALREALVSSLVIRGRFGEAEHEAGVALAARPEGPRAWFLAVRSLTLVFAHRLADADDLAREAEAVAYSEDDRRARALALRTRALAALFESRLADADRFCVAMLEVAAEARGGEPYGAALLVSALIYTDLDRPLDALQVLSRGARVIEASGQPFDAPIIGAYSGAAHFWSGRWDEAAIELATALEARGMAGWFVDANAQLAVIAAARGQRAEAARRAEAAEAAVPIGGPVSSPGRLDWMRGLLAEAEGDLEAARAHLARGWLATEAAGVSRERRTLGPALVRLDRQLSPPDAPGELASPLTARVVTALAGMAERNPQVPGLAGTAAWCDGLASRDGERVVQGLELLRISGRRHEVARCTVDAALLLADQREVAEGLLAAALAEFDQLGAAGERERAVASLRAVGITLPERRQVPRVVGWGALTPTEARVAGLVAEGLSNPEVAARLFVSPRTVSTHVSRILTKLGVRSRTEMAVAVYRERGDFPGASAGHPTG